MFAALPLLVLPVLAYALLALIISDAGWRTLDAGARLSESIVSLRLPSGSVLEGGIGDVLLFVALAVLFVELLRSTSSRKAAVVNHSLSIVLFVVCLVAFLLLEAFGTSTFLLITAMVLLDGLAGFTVSLMGARKDVDLTT